MGLKTLQDLLKTYSHLSPEYVLGQMTAHAESLAVQADRLYLLARFAFCDPILTRLSELPQEMAADISLRLRCCQIQCRYFALLDRDPLLKSRTGIREATGVLGELKSFLGDHCGNDDAEPILMKACAILESICRRLIQLGKSCSFCRRCLLTDLHQYCLEALLYLAVFYESFVPLIGARFLKKRMEIYMTVLNCYAALGYRVEMLKWIKRARAKVEELEDLEKKCFGSLPMDDVTKGHLENAKAKINQQLFLLRIKVKLDPSWEAVATEDKESTDAISASRTSNDSVKKSTQDTHELGKSSKSVHGSSASNATIDSGHTGPVSPSKTGTTGSKKRKAKVVVQDDAVKRTPFQVLCSEIDSHQQQFDHGDKEKFESILALLIGISNFSSDGQRVEYVKITGAAQVYTDMIKDTVNLLSESGTKLIVFSEAEAAAAAANPSSTQLPLEVVKLRHMDIDLVIKFARQLLYLQNWARLDSVVHCLSVFAKTEPEKWSTRQRDDLNLLAAMGNFANRAAGNTFHPVMKYASALDGTDFEKMHAMVQNILQVFDGLSWSEMTDASLHFVTFSCRQIFAALQPLLIRIQPTSEHGFLNAKFMQASGLLSLHQVAFDCLLRIEWTEVALLCTVGTQLAQCFEFLLDFNQAQSAMRVVLGRLQRVRKCLANDDMNSLTSSPALLPAQGKRTQVRSNDHRLAALEVDFSAVYDRLIIKAAIYNAKRQNENAQELRDRLKTRPPSVNDLHQVVLKGIAEFSDPYRRALYWITAAENADATTDRQYIERYLKEAIVELDAALVDEQQLVQYYRAGVDAPMSHPIMLVRRCDTCITVKPGEWLNEESAPAWYRVFCKPLSTKAVSTSDVEFVGTGEYIRFSHIAETTVLGLKPGEQYVLSIAFYDNDLNPLQSGVADSTIPMACISPLPLLHLWSYVLQQATRCTIAEAYERSRNFLWSFFVKSVLPDNEMVLAPIGRHVPASSALFELKDAHLQATPSYVVRTFIQSLLVHHTTEHNDDPFMLSLADGRGSVNLLSNQKRLLARCRELLVTIELALRIEDHNYALIASLKIYHFLSPLLNIDPMPTFMLQCLVLVHQIINKCSERVDAVTMARVMIPYAQIVFALATALHNRKETKALESTAAQSISMLRRFAAYTDPAINNSSVMAQVEVNNYLLNERHKKIKRPTAAQLEYLYDEASNTISLRSYKMRDIIEVKFELLHEYLGMLLPGKDATAIHAKELSNTSNMREFQYMLLNESPEFALAELNKFRKNERYLELVTRLARHAAKDPNKLDFVVTLCMETFKWLHRRNQIILYPDMVKDEEKKSWRRRGYYISMKGTTGNLKSINAVAADKRESKKRGNKNQADEEEQARDGIMEMNMVRGIGVEEAVLISRTVFLVSWKRSRYRKRLRSVIEYEMPWFSELYKIFGTVLLEKAEQLGEDASLNPSSSPATSQSTTRPFSAASSLVYPAPRAPAVDPDWFSLSHGVSLAPSAPSSASTQCDDTGDDLLRLPDVLQSFTQSCVLAARCGQWVQVLNAARMVWNTHRKFTSLRIVSTPAYQTYLWKSFHITSEHLLDMLEKFSITSLDVKQNDSEQYTWVHHRVPPKEELLRMHSPRCIQNRQHLFEWTDRHGQRQSSPVDLDWVCKFILTTVDLLRKSEHFHRMFALIERFNKCTHFVYGDTLAMLTLKIERTLEISPHLIESTKYLLSTLERRHTGAEKELQRCRFMVSQALMKKSLRYRGKFGSGIDAMPTERFELAVSSFKAALEDARAEENPELTSRTLNDLGDLYLDNGDLKMAQMCWEKSIERLTSCDSVWQNWRSMTATTELTMKHFQSVKNCLAAGITVGKLGMYAFAYNLDMRAEMCLFSARLISTTLATTLPHPSELTLMTVYRPKFILPGVNLFNEKFATNPSMLVKLLKFTARELVDLQQADKAIPLISLLEYLSEDVAYDFKNFMSTKLVKLRTLTALGLYAQAIDTILSILDGTILPLAHRKHFFNKGVAPENKWAGKYDDRVPYSRGSNVTILNVIAKGAMSDDLKTVYGKHFVTQFHIARAKLLFTIAQAETEWDGAVVDLSFGLADLAVIDNGQLKKTQMHDITPEEVKQKLASLDLCATVEEIIKSVIAEMTAEIADGGGDGDRHVKFHELCLAYQDLAEVYAYTEGNFVGASRVLLSVIKTIPAYFAVDNHAKMGLKARQWLDLRLAHAKMLAASEQKDYFIAIVPQLLHGCVKFQSTFHEVELLRLNNTHPDFSQRLQALMDRPGVKAQSLGWQASLHELQGDCQRRLDRQSINAGFDSYRHADALYTHLANERRRPHESFPDIFTAKLRTRYAVNKLKYSILLRRQKDIAAYANLRDGLDSLKRHGRAPASLAALLVQEAANALRLSKSPHAREYRKSLLLQAFDLWRRAGTADHVRISECLSEWTILSADDLDSPILHNVVYLSGFVGRALSVLTFETIALTPERSTKELSKHLKRWILLRALVGSDRVHKVLTGWKDVTKNNMATGEVGLLSDKDDFAVDAVMSLFLSSHRQQNDDSALFDPYEKLTRDRARMHQLHQWMTTGCKRYADECTLKPWTLPDLLNAFVLPPDVFALQWLYRGDYQYTVSQQSAILLAPCVPQARKTGDYRAYLAHIDTDHLRQVLEVTKGLKQKIARRGVDESIVKAFRTVIESIRGVLLSDSIPEDNTKYRMPEVSGELLDVLVRVFDVGASPKSVLCSGDLARQLQSVFIPEI